MNSNRIFLLLPAIAASFLLLSCVKDNVKLLRISPDTQMTLCTRSAFPKERAICLSGVYATSGNSESVEYFRNILFRYKNSGEWYENVVWPASGSLNVFGFSADNFDDVSSVEWGRICTERVDLHLNENSTRQDDILFGRASGDFKSTSGILSMRFSHAMSLLTFNFELDDTVESGFEWKRITIDEISVENLYCEADLTALNENEGVRYDWRNLASRHTVTVTYGHLVVIPQMRARINIKFTVQNGDDIKIPFEKVVELEESSRYWEPGVNYEYQIRIRESDVLVQTYVEPWKSDEIIMYFK